MSPRIQGDGGRLRLAWTHLADGTCRAELLGMLLWVEPLSSGWAWLIETDDGERLATFDGVAPLLETQIACEDAARDLLCSALAAFAEKVGPDVCLNYEVDGEAGMGTYDHYAKTSPEDARALAIALLSASQGGGK